MNNCVGQRNYRFFVGFVISTLCLASLELPALLWFAAATGTSGQHLSSRSDAIDYVVIGIVATVGLTAIVLLGLLAYHLFLISTGRTTKEHRRRIVRFEDEPTLCGPRGPRLFNPRAVLSAEMAAAAVGSRWPQLAHVA